MRIYDISFYAAGFFIFGVLAASSKLNFLIIAAATILIAVLFLLFGYFGKSGRLFWLAGLSLFVVVGAFYWFEWRPNKIKERCSAEARFDIRAISEPDDNKRQEFINNYYDDCLMRFGLK